MNQNKSENWIYAIDYIASIFLYYIFFGFTMY